MPLYRHKDRAILLVHIPKTGGSSLEEMLVDAGALQALKFHKRLGFSASTPQHMQWDVLRRWVPKDFYNFSFTVVRNPYARLASEYAWRQTISKKRVPPFNTWVRETFARYSDDPYVLDNHIRPQHEFVGPKVRVFKLEDGLDPAAKVAFRRLGLTYRKPKTPHVRKSDHNVIEIEQSVAQMVRDFYAEDFDAFGYDPDILPEHLFTVVPEKIKEPVAPPAPLVVEDTPVPTQKSMLTKAATTLGSKWRRLRRAGTRIVHRQAKQVAGVRSHLPVPVYNALRSVYRWRHPGHPAARAYVKAVSADTPLNQNHVLYESFHGKSFNCSPAAICLALLDDPSYAHLTHIWAVNDPAVLPAELTNHPNVRWVKRRTAEYGQALATASHIITNTTLEPFFARRDGQIYANTWHGVPLKRMFRHEGSKLTRHANSQRNFIQASHILMPNTYTAEALMGSADVAEAVASRVSCIGAPRVDLTLSPERDDLRAQLGIGPDVRVILVAPTWRGTIGRGDAMPEIDALLDQLNTLDPDRYMVFVQMHDFVASPNTRARALPSGLTTNQFLAAVDTLITDYSSIMFDFFATGRQVVLFAYDLEHYSETRGLIADLDTLPAPTCKTVEEVVTAVQLGERSDTDPRYAAARDTYFGQDDGQATSRAINAIFDTPVAPRAAQRPRILIFGGSWKNNGITSSATNLLGALAEYDADVYLVTNGVEIDRNAEYATNIRRLHPNIRILHRTGTMAASPEDRAHLDAFYRTNTIETPDQAAAIDRLFTREARRMFGDMSFDVAIDFSGYARFWAMLFANVPATRRVIYQHNDMKSEAEQRFDILNGVFASYKRFDAVVSVSPATCALNLENLSANYTSPTAATSVRNMIDPSKILAAAEEDLPSDLSLPEDSTVFVSVGRMSNEKAQERMIRAIATLHDQGATATLVLIGDGPLRHELEALAQELGVKDRVIFAGQKPNPFAIMARCDCFVLSSDYEGQPMVLLEALTLGLPIVATDIAGTRSVLDAKHSILVDPSTEGVTTGMRQVLSGQAKTAVFDANAYCETVMQEFMERVVGQPIRRSH